MIAQLNSQLKFNNFEAFKQTTKTNHAEVQQLFKFPFPEVISLSFHSVGWPEAKELLPNAFMMPPSKTKQ